MRFLHRDRQSHDAPYLLAPAYRTARAEFLARTPAANRLSATERFPRVWAVAVDFGEAANVVSVYALADGTASIYSSNGLHLTGTGHVAAVADSALDLLEAAELALGAMEPADDSLLPEPGSVAVRVRTFGGDLQAIVRHYPRGRHGPLGDVAVAAEIVMTLANKAVVEGFVEADVAEESGYEIAAGYRRMRRTMLAMEPASAPDDLPRVRTVVVDVGRGGGIVSLFAFADGTISVLQTDGEMASRLGHDPDAARIAHGLLLAVDAALDAFETAPGLPLPAQDRVQLAARLRPGADHRGPFVRGSAGLDELRTGGHPLSAAFAVAEKLFERAALSNPAIAVVRPETAVD